MNRFHALWLNLFLAANLFALNDELRNENSIQKALASVVTVKIQRSPAKDDDASLLDIDAGGTGLVLDENHHIVTNAHVLKNATKIVVIDQNDSEYPAFIVGKDEKTDIAVLEAKELMLPPIQDANTTSLSVGKSVYAIGSPYSLGHSVSMGIVSHINRFLPNYPYLRYIQTDAAINPGNSGGGLFDQNGSSLGIVSTYFSKNGGYTNIGFAIPIEDVRRITKRIIDEKSVKRGCLGTQFLLSSKISRLSGYPKSILITDVDTASPAELAGVVPGDIIIGIDAHPLKDEGEVYRAIERSQPGSKLMLQVMKKATTVEIPITLGECSDHTADATNTGSSDNADKLGIIAGQTDKGISVIASYRTAQLSGIKRGDEIIALNDVKVMTIDQLNQVLSTIKENTIGFITLKRNGNLFKLPIGHKNILKGYSTRN